MATQTKVPITRAAAETMFSDLKMEREKPRLRFETEAAAMGDKQLVSELEALSQERNRAWNGDATFDSYEIKPPGP